MIKAAITIPYLFFIGASYLPSGLTVFYAWVDRQTGGPFALLLSAHPAAPVCGLAPLCPLDCSFRAPGGMGSLVYSLLSSFVCAFDRQDGRPSLILHDPRHGSSTGLVVANGQRVLAGPTDFKRLVDASIGVVQIMEYII